MSNRHLQREAKKKIVEEEPEDEIEEQPITNNRSNFNPFAFLSEEGDLPPVSNSSPTTFTSPSTPTSRSKAQKKRQNRRNKKKQQKENTPNTEEENINKIIEEINSNSPSTTTTTTSTNQIQNDPLDDILFFTPKFLNSNFELKKLFGSKTILSHSKETSHHTPPAFRSKSLKKTHAIVDPKPSWPPLTSSDTGGITMDLTQSLSGGFNNFNLIWSNSYRKLQEQFYLCVETNDPNTLMEFLQFHPYHFDSLIQLSEIAKMQQEYETATDLIERTLFFFENIWTKVFFPLTPSSTPIAFTGLAKYNKLLWSNEYNRPIFLALFRNIQMLSKRGCARTALEHSKFLWNLDWSDPLGILNIIDHFALRSKEYEWLIGFINGSNDLKKFYENLEKDSKTKFPTIPGKYLPNMMYSFALCKFHLGNEEEAGQDLREAIRMFPGFIEVLVEKCGWSKIKEWDGILNLKKIKSLLYNGNGGDVLKALLCLYVERNHAIWKVDVIQNFLKKNLKILNDEEYIGEKEIEDLRRNYYLIQSGEEFYDHILLSDVTSAINYLPGTHRVFRLYETLVPTQTDNVVHASTNNPLALFLQTLMPWVQVPTGPMQGDDAGAGVGAGAGDQGWLAGVFQNFLQQAEQGEHPENEDSD